MRVAPVIPLAPLRVVAALAVAAILAGLQIGVSWALLDAVERGDVATGVFYGIAATVLAAAAAVVIALPAWLILHSQGRVGAHWALLVGVATACIAYWPIAWMGANFTDVTHDPVAGAAYIPEESIDIRLFVLPSAVAIAPSLAAWWIAYGGRRRRSASA